MVLPRRLALTLICVVGAAGRFSAPDNVFESVSSRVSALEAQLKQTELDDRQKLLAREAKYEQQVAAEQKANDQIDRENKALAAEVEGLTQTTAELRKKAVTLQADIEKWGSDWHRLEDNISTALELSSSTLQEIRRLKRAPQTRVLAELRQDEETVARVHQKQAEFNDIAHPPNRLGGSSRLSLLQVQRMPMNGGPRSILMGLDAGFEELAKEQEQKLAELKAKYRPILQEQQDRTKTLEKERAALQAQKDSLLPIVNRLSSAIKFLEDSRSKMEVQGRSIRMFAQRLGIRAIPHRQHVPTPHEIQVSDAMLEPTGSHSGETAGLSLAREETELSAEQARDDEQPRAAEFGFEAGEDVAAPVTPAPRPKAAFLSFLSDIRPA